MSTTGCHFHLEKPPASYESHVEPGMVNSPFSIEGSVLELDMPVLQQAACLGVRVCINHCDLGQIHLVVR